MSSEDFLQKKLFGPFNGLNSSRSPLLREEPPSPNAAPREYATEWENFIIDPKTQELVSRSGIEFVEKGSNAATSGLFPFIDYDVVTGLPRKTGVQLSVSSSGVPTLTKYRLIRTEIRATDASLTGKKFAIIEDPDTSYAKKFMIYNSNDTVFASYSTLAAVSNVSIEYTDYDSARDGSFILSAVDLCPPTTLTLAGSSATPNKVASFYSLAKYTFVGSTELGLSVWLDTLDDTDAKLFTAAQLNNVIYFSNGVTPLLKFDGVALYKAGMMPGTITNTQPLINAQVSVTTLNNFMSPAAIVVGAVYDNLGLASVNATTGTAGTALVGTVSYGVTYEKVDNKNNSIEGTMFVSPSVSAGLSPIGSSGNSGIRAVMPDYNHLTNIDYSPTPSGNVSKYTIVPKPPGKGYDARSVEVYPRQAGDAPATYHVFSSTAGLVSAGVNVYKTSSIGGSDTYNTLISGEKCCFRAMLTPAAPFTAAPSLTVQDNIDVLIEAYVLSSTYTSGSFATFKFDTTKPIRITFVPAGNPLANSYGVVASVVDTYTLIEGLSNVINTLESITTWDALFSFNWSGMHSATTYMFIYGGFAISNNIRMNIYRTKGEGIESYSTDPIAAIPTYYLHNIFPINANAPDFTSPQDLGSTAVRISWYDNCRDAGLGAAYDAKVPLEVGGVVFDSTQTIFNAFTTLPKGAHCSSNQTRLYITRDPENDNILHRSSTVYGPEWFDPNDALSMETPIGDDMVAVVANNTAQFVLKDNSVKIILNDLSNENIRIDDVYIGKYGCVAPKSAVQVKDGIAYLTSQGPAYLRIDSQIEYLGANEQGISRIRDLLLNDTTLDLKRAVGFVDLKKEQYILYVPRVDNPASGLYNPSDLRNADNPYYNDNGKAFIYDFYGDTWSTQTGFNAKGGIVALDGDRLFYMSQYCVNTSETASTLEWGLFKERDYANLWTYADRLERGGTQELRAITKTYATDWIGFGSPNIMKKFLRFKAYCLSAFTALTVLGSSNTPLVTTGSTTLTLTTYKDWRTDTSHTASTLSLTSAVLFAICKLLTNKSFVMKFKVVHNTIFNSPRIQALEVEAAAPFKTKMKGWGRP